MSVNRDSKRIIYAFSMPEHKGFLKIGQTRRSAEERIKDIMNSLPYETQYKIELDMQVFDEVSDIKIHKYLLSKGFERVGNEWFKCTVKDVKGAIDHLEQECLLTMFKEIKKFKLLPRLYKKEYEPYINVTDSLILLKLLVELKDSYSLDEIYSLLLQISKMPIPIKEFKKLDKETIKNHEKINEVIKDFNKLGYENTSQIEELLKKIEYIYNLCNNSNYSIKELIQEADKLEETLVNKGFNNITSMRAIANIYRDIQDTHNRYNIDISRIYNVVSDIKNLKEFGSVEKFIKCVEDYEELKEGVNNVKKQLKDILRLLKIFNTNILIEYEQLLQDIEIDKSCLWKIIEQDLATKKECLPTIISREDSLSYSLSFGKYRGKTIKEVSELDIDYLEWLKDSYIDFLCHFMPIEVELTEP